MKHLSLKPRTLSLVVLALSLSALACGPKYPKCEKDENCAAKGEVCVDGLCQQCRDDAQCKAGEMCKGGRCEVKPECSKDGDCKSPQVCRTGKCQIECNADGDCGAGMKCSANRCVDKLACSGPSDCGAGMECKSGRCSMIEASRSMCNLPTIYFDYNEANLTASSQKALADSLDCLKQGGTIVIEGHCDERGTEEYNLALGDRRARAVERYLKNLGVGGGKIDVRSKGKLEPADPGHDEAAWAKNRRAVFVPR
ncbi:MAG: OmpA family protein [Myxococcota bacterium]